MRTYKKSILRKSRVWTAGYLFLREALKNKIPIELITSAQALGNKLDWIRIDGSGSNALDFHIAYYFGKLVSADPSNEYFILSKDKGFDLLAKHMS
jgi:hypothetical protein